MVYKFIAVTLLLCLYTGGHVYAAFGRLIGSRVIFSILFLIFAESYVIVQFFRRSLEMDVPAFFFWFSSAVIGFMSLLVMASILFDIVFIFALITKKLLPIYNFIINHRAQVGIVALAAVFIVFIYGHINAITPRVTHYAIDINKDLPTPVRIVAVSDLHITSFTSLNALEKMVEQINALEPDLVVMVGDIIDGELDPFIERDIKGFFYKIVSKYGVYSVLGNHERYGRSNDNASLRNAYQDAYIPLLIDEVVYIKELNLTLVGRNDYSSRHYGEGRVPLAELLDGVPADSAVVVLDHQPQNVVLEEAAASGVDLQLSGHTHNGQFFPVNFIVGKIYKNAWGLMTEGAYNLIVSCGFGTWGPSMRTGSYSEIVDITIK